MYEDYWQFNEKPFENTSLEQFYYPSEVHQATLLKLHYAVENRRPAGLLTGVAGLGKTLLVKKLFDQLDTEFSPRIHVVFPLMPYDQLLAHLANELAAAPSMSTTPTVDQSVRWIENALAENVEMGRHAVLAIDEAHLLKDLNSLQMLRLLLNFEASSPSGLTLLLVGQTEILPVLDRMPGLEEQMSVKCLLRPFTVEETSSYVVHRLTAAGRERPVFDSEALETIHVLTGGVPRRIDRLCDLTLLIGYAEEQSSIRPEHVESVSEEMVSIRPD